MGLASKLAAAQAASGGAPGGGYSQPPSSTPQFQQPPQQQYQQPPQTQTQTQGQGYQQPPSQQYQQPPSQQYQQPPSQQYQQPPPQYGAPQTHGQGQGQGYGAQQGGYAGVGAGAPGVPGRPGAPSSTQPGQYYQAPQGGQAGYGQQQGYGGYGQQQQQGYAPPPGPPPGMQAAGGYGQAPAPGGAPATGAFSQQAILSVLTKCVTDQHIEAFYPPNSGQLQQIAATIAQSGVLSKVATAWRLPGELAVDLAQLALFDIVLLIDDSGSIAFEENGERIKDLELILSRVAFATSLFDQDGIEVHFLNNPQIGRGINSEQAAMQLLQNVKYRGLTPTGTRLGQLIDQTVLGPARQGTLRKPVSIIIVTDGETAGEPKDAVPQAILRADAELRKSRYGPDAVSYQFAQVGNDRKAQAFLERLDNDRQIGGLIDVTSNFEQESDEFMRKHKADLTPDMWIQKMLLGSIDSSYDTADE